jgi:carbonic anhydrase
VKNLPELFRNNRAWAERIARSDPDFFEKLARQQSPKYLWIGCSDSRVPANDIVGLLPGELFVHRNVANLVVHTDLNCLSVMQFAVDALHVEHIIVCGHYGCSGVRAALMKERHGLADNWLRHVEDVQQQHAARLAKLPDDGASGDRSGDRRFNLLCELNVIEQVSNVCRSSILEDAWSRGQQVTVHGWIYDIHDGLLRDLDTMASSPAETAAAYERAMGKLLKR